MLAYADKEKKESARSYNATVHDVVILGQAYGDGCFIAKYGEVGKKWNNVVYVLQQQFPDVKIDGHAAQKRATQLIDWFRTGELVSMHSSGTEPEYDEREKLLQHMVLLLDGVEEKKAEGKGFVEKRNALGDQVVNR